MKAEASQQKAIAQSEAKILTYITTYNNILLYVIM